MRVAGKTSTNISIERDKKRLFENLENINKAIYDEVANSNVVGAKPVRTKAQLKPRPLTSAPLVAPKIKTSETPKLPRFEYRRSGSSHGSRSSHNNNNMAA